MCFVSLVAQKWYFRSVISIVSPNYANYAR